MGKAADGEAYFQRGSLFWFTVITLSFGYYTVKAARAASERLREGRGPVAQAQPGAGARSGGRLQSPEKDAGALAHPHLPPVLQAPGNRLLGLSLRGGGGGDSDSLPPKGSVSTSFKMVAAKSGAGKDAYFRTARPWPSLVTALALGYFTVRHRPGGRLFSRPGQGRGLRAARACACAPAVA